MIVLEHKREQVADYEFGAILQKPKSRFDFLQNPFRLRRKP